MAGKVWRHDELLLDLAQHLQRPERMLWMDMQMGSAGSPRPDVYTMDKSYVRPRPISYEIKVSVADFRRDVTSGKWQNYLAFSSAVVFCVPAGLITKSDLPGGCGLMVRGDDGWRTLKAPTLNPVELKREHMLKLLIDGVERASQAHRIREINTYLQNEKIRELLGEKVAKAIRDPEELLRDAQREADHIVYRATAEATDIKAQVERMGETEKHSLKELKLALGLPEDTSTRSVLSAAKNFREKHDADERLDSARIQVKWAVENLKGCLAAIGGDQ